MNKTIEQERADQFKEGVQYALEYLSSLYEGVYETDLAQEYDPDAYEGDPDDEEEEE